MTDEEQPLKGRTNAELLGLAGERGKPPLIQDEDGNFRNMTATEIQEWRYYQNLSEADKRAIAERAEYEMLQKAGADYSGMETWRAFMRRCGRSQ